MTRKSGLHLPEPSRLGRGSVMELGRLEPRTSWVRFLVRSERVDTPTYLRPMHAV